MEAIANHQVILNQHILSLKIRFSILADTHKPLPAGALPIEKNVAPHGNAVTAEIGVTGAVVILDDNVAAGVVAVGTATAGKIVEENVVLNDHIRDTIDIDVLIRLVCFPPLEGWLYQTFN